MTDPEAAWLDGLTIDPGLRLYIDGLRIETGRLRAALRRIGGPRHEITYCRDGHEEAVLHARAVLKEGAYD